MAIDLYTHFFPPAYAEAIARTTSRQHPDVPDLRLLQGVFPNLCQLDLRLPHMDRYGSEVQVLTPLPIPPGQFIADVDRQTPGQLSRIANDALAEAVVRQRDRFVGVALLSFRDIDSAVAEMHRAVDELRFAGAMLFTNIEGEPLDSERLFPIYRTACALDVPLWLHPVSWNYYPWVRDYLIWQIFGWPLDTTLAMARIVYGGVFDRFPQLKLITHHAGGAVPSLIGRVIDTYDQRRDLLRVAGTEPSAKVLESPPDAFRRFYADTAVSGVTNTLRGANELFGNERLVFGSDYPFGPELGERFLRANLEAVEQLGLSEADTEKILDSNARQLLRRDRKQECAAD